jgi:hypothetical protein
MSAEGKQPTLVRLLPDHRLEASNPSQPERAVRDAEVATLVAVRDGGRICTITGGPPSEPRGISIVNLYVAPDGPRLARLAELATQDRLRIRMRLRLPLERAPQALAEALLQPLGG